MFVSKAFPSNYVQQPGVLKDAADWFKKFGKKPFIISGPTAWGKVEEALVSSLQQGEMDYQLEIFAGHCSYEELERLLGLRDSSTDFVVGIGGGQSLDMSKIVANRLELPIITLPTLASTCAATSPQSIMYTPDHVFVKIEKFDFCPILTLVDTGVIQNAPLPYLVSGIGDTLVKWYEAYPINEGKEQNARTKAGLKIAELAKEQLLEYSEKAIEECKSGADNSEALSQVIDTNILLGGLVGGLGSHTCQTSGAHSINYGMTNIPQTSHALHGDVVAFGLLVQLMLEDKPAEMEELMSFYQNIGLPICLADLAEDPISEEDLALVASKSCEPARTIHHLQFPVTAENILKSIKKVDEIGSRKKASK